MIDLDVLYMKQSMLGRTLSFVECGCCGQLHPLDFIGDCRDDANRFTFDQLDERWGVDGYCLAIEDQEGDPT